MEKTVESLAGYVEHIIYRNADNGYTDSLHPRFLLHTHIYFAQFSHIPAADNCLRLLCVFRSI